MAGRILKITDQGQVRLFEAVGNGQHKINLQAPSSVAADVTFTLPGADGTNGQFLKTDGAGTLSFATGSSTLQSAYDAGKTIAIGTDAIALTIAGNTDDGMTITKTGTGTGKVLHITDAGTDDAMRITKTGAGASLAIVHTGNVTAMTISNSTANACLHLTANGNSAALQITQADDEDAIDVNGADIRCGQAIADTNLVIYNNGALQFGEFGHTSSGDFFDVLEVNASNQIFLGQATEDWQLNLRTGAAQAINFITNGSTRFSLASTGVLSSTQATANGMVSLTKSNVGNGVVLALSNAGTGIGLSVTQTGAEDAIRVVISENGTGVQVTQSFNTARAGRFQKTGTGGNPALEVTNAGTGDGLLVTQTGDGVGLRVTMASGLASNGLQITHSATGDVADIAGTSTRWKITNKGNGVFKRFSLTSASYTIASGAIVIAQGGLCKLTGEGAAADDLDTITSDSNDPITDGQILVLMAADDAVTITVTEAGNIRLDGGSKVLDSNQDTLMVMWVSALSVFVQVGGFCTNN